MHDLLISVVLESVFDGAAGVTVDDTSGNMLRKSEVFIVAIFIQHSEDSINETVKKSRNHVRREAIIHHSTHGDR